MNGAGRKKAGRQAAAVKRSIAEEHVERISGRAAIFALIVIGVFLYSIQTAIIPFVVAGMVAYIATPLIERIARRLRLHRTLAAIAVFIVLVALGVAMVRLGLLPLIRAGAALAGDLHGTIQRTAQDFVGNRNLDLFGHSLSAPDIADRAVEMLRAWLAATENLMTLATASAAVFFGTILTAVVLFYFLVSGPQIAEGLFWLVPPRQRLFVHYLWSKLDPALKRYFVGLSVVVLYSACAAYLGLGFALDIRHAFFLALMTGLFEVVPFVGPITAAIIAGLVALTQATGIWDIVAYAVYATVLRVSIDQFLAPVVLGRAGRIHPTLVIFCFAAGGVLFGFAGVLLAVPVALSIKVVLETVYDEPK